MVGNLVPHTSVQLESGCPFLGISRIHGLVDDYGSKLAARKDSETIFFVTLEIVGNTVSKVSPVNKI